MKHEIIRKKQYQNNLPRQEYELTEKGKDLFPIIVSLMKWEDTWIYGAENVPIRLLDSKSMKKKKSPVLVEENSGKRIVFGNVRTVWGAEEFKEEWLELSEVTNKHSNK